MAEATKRLVRDKDGKPKIIDEVKPPSGARSFFDDDEGDALFSGVIFLDGQAVRVRELTATEMASYAQGEEEISALMAALGKATEADEAKALADDIKTRQTALYDSVIARGVASWDLKRPDGTPVDCTPEAKQKLRISCKAELSDKIVHRSAMGRDLGEFLQK